MDEVSAGPYDREKKSFDGECKRRRVGSGHGWSGAEKFAVGVANAEKTPDLAPLRGASNELRKHGAGEVADEATGMLFPTGAPLESPDGEPTDEARGVVVEDITGYYSVFRQP